MAIILKLQTLSHTINTTSINDIIRSILLISISFGYLFLFYSKENHNFVKQWEDAKAVGLPWVAKVQLYRLWRMIVLNLWGDHQKNLSICLSLWLFHCLCLSVCISPLILFFILLKNKILSRRRTWYVPQFTQTYFYGIQTNSLFLSPVLSICNHFIKELLAASLA